MSFLVLVGFFSAWIWVWIWVSRKLGQTGKGRFFRHSVGGFAGLFAGYLVVCLALLLGIISPVKKETGTEAVVQKVEPMPEVISETKKLDVPPMKTLRRTAEEYEILLNDAFRVADLKYRVNATTIEKGAVNDLLNITIGKYTVLVARISKVNGELLDVVVMGSGDGTPASGLDIMMVASAALTAASRDVGFSEVFRGMPAMIKGQERTYGDVKLSAKDMDGMGIWFFASPI